MTTKPPAIICDLDGTLCNCEHRRHHVTGDKRDFIAFFKAMGEDTVNWHVNTLVNELWHRDYKVLLVSGRYEKYRNVTESWLMHLAGPYHELHMRADADHRDDVAVKEGIYRWLIEPHYDVRLVLDDRARVVDMWRGLGLECWQVAKGDF